MKTVLAVEEGSSDSCGDIGSPPLMPSGGRRKMMKKMKTTLVRRGDDNEVPKVPTQSEPPEPTKLEGGEVFQDLENKNGMNVQTVCEFKRGGFCKTHNMMGRKDIHTKKVWTKLSDGSFGWRVKRQTYYHCENITMNVPQNHAHSTISEPSTALGVGRQRSQGELGVQQSTPVFSDGLAGRGLPGAGANTRESERISSWMKEKV